MGCTFFLGQGIFPCSKYCRALDISSVFIISNVFSYNALLDRDSNPSPIREDTLRFTRHSSELRFIDYFFRVIKVFYKPLKPFLDLQKCKFIYQRVLYFQRISKQNNLIVIKIVKYILIIISRFIFLYFCSKPSILDELAKFL